jgi:hypothetical protein
MTGRNINLLDRILLLLSILILATILCSGCNLPGNSPQPTTVIQMTLNDPNTPTPVPTGEKTAMPEVSDERPMSLEEGQQQSAKVIPVAASTGEPMPESELANILSRLPALPPKEEIQSDFKLAQDILPPPRTGEKRFSSRFHLRLMLNRRSNRPLALSKSCVFLLKVKFL